ncbi:MAG: hypothetical protein A3C55_06035 [Gammaproteobacteria bacterium RIFCSPHIGHO2_02_FULL_42_13]|nr:MAG: hypothetical protein A3C55_06035 [Gammaproteobacteria bacterium RIFCSPHIGHO2_02_FULL_42_13]
MKVILRCLSIIVVLSLTACASVQQGPATRTTQLQGVQSVVASGPMHLKVTAGNRASTLKTIVNQSLRQNVSADVKNGTLYISGSTGWSRDATSAVVEVNLQTLKDLSVNKTTSVCVQALAPMRTNFSAISANDIDIRGAFMMPNFTLDQVARFYMKGYIDLGNVHLVDADQVNIVGLQSGAMNITQQGGGSVDMHGYSNVTNVDQMGSAELNLFWSNSQMVRVNLSGSAKLNIAGVTKKIVVHATNSSQLNARYLIAKVAYVRVDDSVIANVFASHKLFAQAADRSQVHYYGWPKLLESYPEDSGVIIGLTRQAK